MESKLNSELFEEAVRNRQLLKQEEQNLKNSLSEVSGAIRRRMQWSPVLEIIVNNMPKSMVLRSINVRQESRKVKKPQNDNPEKKVDVVVPIKTLVLSMVGTVNGNYDQEVRTFRDSLMAEKLLSSRLEDIRVAQEMDKRNDMDIISYEIFLVFKPAQ